MKGNPDFNPSNGGGDNFWLANVKLVSNVAGGIGAFTGTPLIHRAVVPYVQTFTEEFYGQWLSAPIGLVSFAVLGVAIFAVIRTVASEAIKRNRGGNPPAPRF